MYMHIFLFVLDSMRYDRLSCTGYRRKGMRTTPNLDELAKESVFFRRAFSAGPGTAASMPALFTGKHISNMDFSGVNSPLSENHETIPTMLKKAGFRNHAISTVPFVNEERKFDRGFDFFQPLYKPRFIPNIDWIKYLGWVLINGKDSKTKYIMDSSKKLVEKNKNNNFFLYAQFMNPHKKYSPPRPFREYVEELTQSMDKEKINKIVDWGMGRDYNLGNFDLSEEEFDYIESLYDGEVAYLDSRLGEFIGWLKDKGIYDNSMIIITADHGENFGKGHRVAHGGALYEELVHVPLIIKLPKGKRAGKVVGAVVSLTDIFPTISKVAGLKERKDIDGKGLPPLREKHHNCVFSEIPTPSNEALEKLKERAKKPLDLKKFGRGIKCARTKKFKYLIYSDGEEWLLKPEEDPLEEKDFSEDNKETLKALRDKVKENLGGFGTLNHSDLRQDEEMKRRLEALGYIE